MYNLKPWLFPLVFILALNACGTGGYEPEEDQEEETFTPTEPVPADSVLEAVTWNLNWYGDGTYDNGSGSGNGPRDEQQQREHIVTILDSLNADLYAFQEVHGGEALEDITERLGGYEGFVAEHIEWIQKTAFVYNTNTIDSLEAGGIMEGQGQDLNAWANGRFPLFFRFMYTFEEESREFYAIVIHAKAFDDEESYERRRQAAADLYNYLQEEHPEASIIFLGDYNDDVDVSIYREEETPYQPFKEAIDYRILTQVLSESDSSSTTDYPDMIDHITVSDEVFPLYLEGSAAVYTDPEGYISSYSSTTSDHYPVWAKFVITRN